MRAYNAEMCSRHTMYRLPLLLIVVLLGCRSKAEPTTTAVRPGSTAMPSTDLRTFSDPSAGIELSYPTTWRPQPSQDYVLELVPAGESGADPQRSLSLDVPSLPFHLPGMIPMSLVKSGYLDDLRKKVGPIQVQEQTPPTIPNAQAQQVRSTWQKDGQSFSETALLLTHADHVYILRATTDAAGLAPTQAAMDAMVRSLKWTK